MRMSYATDNRVHSAYKHNSQVTEEALLLALYEAERNMWECFFISSPEHKVLKVSHCHT